jgi:hypothetical protein
MTLRIESGDLLIDSGSLANSADCCCGEEDCTGKCETGRVLPACADPACNCISAAYGTNSCQGGFEVDLSLTTTPLRYDGTFGGSCTPSGCPNLDGIYQTADCNSDVFGEACGPECSFTNGVGATQYALATMAVNVSATTLGDGVTWQVTLEVFSGVLTRTTSSPWTAGQCGSNARSSTLLLRNVYRYVGSEVDDWEFEPGVNCPDVCNSVVQRRLCVSSGTALTLFSTTGGSRTAGQGGCNLSSYTAAVTFL